MFKKFIKRNYKNDVYKVEIINMKELEEIKENDSSLEEKNDNQNILQKEIELKNNRISEMINELQTVVRQRNISFVVVIVVLLLMLLFFTFYNNLDTNTLSKIEEISPNTEITDIKEILINFYDAINKNVEFCITFFVAVFTYYLNTFNNNLMEERQYKRYIYEFGEKLYINGQLNENNKYFFDNKILKIKSKKSNVDKINKSDSTSSSEDR